MVRESGVMEERARVGGLEDAVGWRWRAVVTVRTEAEHPEWGERGRGGGS